MITYPQKFSPGDKARCNKYICFTNGQYHQYGQVVEVTDKNYHYYNVNYQDYDKVEDKEL